MYEFSSLQNAAAVALLNGRGQTSMDSHQYGPGLIHEVESEYCTEA